MKITGSYLSLTLASAYLLAQPAFAQTPPKAEEKGTLSIVVENDKFVNTDRAYTSGVRASWVTATHDTPDWAVALARSLPLFANWGVVRAEYALQQVIFTPRNTDIAVPDPLDRPYAGWLHGTFGLIGETGSILDQVSLGIGVVGPASLAQEAQTLVHNIEGISSPRGWAYQLRNEPTIQLRYQRSWRALAAYAFNSDYGVDLTPHVGGTLGNVYTFANAGVTFRIGKDLQQDFGPPRVGPSVPGSGFFVPRDRLGWYFFAGLEGRAVARNIFLDGNTFVNSRRVTKLPFVADLQAGFALTINQLRISYTQVWRSREFTGQPSNETFGALSASLRW